LLSAASVFSAIDKNKSEVVPLGITKEGRWLTSADAHVLSLPILMIIDLGSILKTKSTAEMNHWPSTLLT